MLSTHCGHKQWLCCAQEVCRSSAPPPMHTLAALKSIDALHSRRGLCHTQQFACVRGWHTCSHYAQHFQVHTSRQNPCQLCPALTTKTDVVQRQRPERTPGQKL